MKSKKLTFEEAIKSYGEEMAKLYEKYTFFNGYHIDKISNKIELSFTYMNDKFWVDIPKEVIDLYIKNK